MRKNLIRSGAARFAKGIYTLALLTDDPVVAEYKRLYPRDKVYIIDDILILGISATQVDLKRVYIQDIGENDGSSLRTVIVTNYIAGFDKFWVNHDILVPTDDIESEFEGLMETYNESVKSQINSIGNDPVGMIFDMIGKISPVVLIQPLIEELVLSEHPNLNKFTIPSGQSQIDDGLEALGGAGCTIL